MSSSVMLPRPNPEAAAFRYPQMCPTAKAARTAQNIPQLNVHTPHLREYEAILLLLWFSQAEMASETRRFIELSDIIGLEITCRHWKTQVSFKFWTLR